MAAFSCAAVMAASVCSDVCRRISSRCCGEFADPQVDPFGLVTQIRETLLFLLNQPRRLDIEQPQLDLVDALQVVDLDPHLALLDGELLPERLRVGCLHHSQPRVPVEAGALFLEGVNLSPVLDSLGRNINLVLQALLVEARLPVEPLLDGLLLLLQVGGHLLLLHRPDLGAEFPLQVGPGLCQQRELPQHAPFVHESAVLENILLECQAALSPGP